MRKLRVTEVLVVQGNQSPQDAISIGTKCVSVTITCAPTSNNDVWVGWNENATSKNLLQQGDSKPYGGIEGYYLDDNKLYVSFDPTGSGGIALVSITNDTGEEC